MTIWGWRRSHWYWIFWIELIIFIDEGCSLRFFSLGFKAKMLFVFKSSRLVLLDGHIFCILILIYNQKVLMLELIICVSLEFVLCFHQRVTAFVQSCILELIFRTAKMGSNLGLLLWNGTTKSLGGCLEIAFGKIFIEEPIFFCLIFPGRKNGK